MGNTYGEDGRSGEAIKVEDGWSFLKLTGNVIAGRRVSPNCRIVLTVYEGPFEN